MLSFAFRDRYAAAAATAVASAAAAGADTQNMIPALLQVFGKTFRRSTLCHPSDSNLSLVNHPPTASLSHLCSLFQWTQSSTSRLELDGTTQFTLIKVLKYIPTFLLADLSLIASSLASVILLYRDTE